MCGALFFAVLRLDFFTISRIEIMGIKRVSEKEVLKRSGLRVGKNMISFLEANVTEEILKNPWIKSAYIKREFPGKVIIEIKEFEPFCLVLGGDGEIYYMSETGKKLGKANFDEGLDFPLITGEVIVESELLGEALGILKLSLKSVVFTWKEISEINLSSIYGITVFTIDKRRIDFGEGNVAGKWHKVERIINHARRINLTEKYINISSEKIGIVNFKL
jgi:cell division protein FtsQ